MEADTEKNGVNSAPDGTETEAEWQKHTERVMQTGKWESAADCAYGAMSGGGCILDRFTQRNNI